MHHIKDEVDIQENSKTKLRINQALFFIGMKLIIIKTLKVAGFSCNDVRLMH